MRLTKGSGVPLALLIFGLTLGACAGVLVVSVEILKGTDHVSGPLWEVVLAGCPAAVAIAVIAAVAEFQVSRSVRRMQARASAVDAMHRRVNMADEVAERHRRAAETASAGMYELLSGLVGAEEAARGQLAAELHDTVAQSLTMARVLLDDRRNPGSIGRAVEMVSEAEEQVRAVMARTRPPALRDGDLARAIAALRDDLANRYGMEISVSWPEEPHPLPLVSAITVYRFFQEALLNVVKHAEVDQARVELQVDDNWVTAVVADQGLGFVPDAVTSEGGRHVGLGLLRERARLVGGSLDVTSWRGAGTTLMLRLPRLSAATGVALATPLEPTRADDQVGEQVG
ncbi:MAG TPA: ATP-binding protein [Mycobacteriales bacterium]|jgi:signal transduction histidine kinase|nr:ATP-binding protein [Mycobacteriales bacterium]